MSRRAAVVLAAVTVLVVLAAPATAKGPTGATITGPGLDDPIVIEGLGERGAGDGFPALVEAAGFWILVGGMDAFGPGKVLDGPPAGQLGPMYQVAWHLGDDTADAAVYLDADGGPVVHVAAERIADSGYIGAGGWFAAPSSLRDLLAGYGVPVRDTPQVKAPARSTGSTAAAFFALGGALVLLSGSVLWAVGRRPRRVGAP